MTPDVKGLLLGAGQANPVATRATHLGRRTADSPFAVLLASAAHGPAAHPAAGLLPGASPAVDAAAPEDREAALATPFDAPAQELEDGTPGTHVSEEAQGAPESSPSPAPAPVPAPAGTGVTLPPPAQPGPAEPAQLRLAAAGAPQARPLHQRSDMREAASADRREHPAEEGEPSLAAAPPALPATADPAAGEVALAPRASPHAPPAAPATSTAAGHQPASVTAPRREAPPEGAPPPPEAAASSPPHAMSPPAAPPHAAPPLAGPPAAAAVTAAAAAIAAPAPSQAWRAAARATAPAEPPQPQAAPPDAPAASEPPAASPQAVRRGDRRAAPPDLALPQPGRPSRPAPGRAEQAAEGTRDAPPPPPVAAGPVAARMLGTSARLSQASRAATPLREPPAGKSTRPAHAAEGAPQAPFAPQAAPPAPEPASRATQAPRPAPILAPEPAQTLAAGTILPHTAHLRLESETLGDLALHLRVRDGVAHVRLEGDQASQLAGRGLELQRALAAEGLKLGQLEVERPAVPPSAPEGQARASADQGAPQGQRDRPDRDDALPGPTAAATAGPARRPAGRSTAHHVEA